MNRELRSMGRYLMAAAMLCLSAGVAYGDVLVRTLTDDRLHALLAFDSSLDDTFSEAVASEAQLPAVRPRKDIPTVKGTIEEMVEIASATIGGSFTLPSYTSTEIQTQDGLFRSKEILLCTVSIGLGPYSRSCIRCRNNKEFTMLKPEICGRRPSVASRWTASCYPR